MTENNEKRPLPEAFKGIITNAEELRNIALKCFEKGYIDFDDYTKICKSNKLLIF